MKVRFVDLSAQHKPLEAELKDVFSRVAGNPARLMKKLEAA